MPGLIVHVSAQMQCPHGGLCQPTAPALRVLVAASPAAALLPSGPPPLGVGGCLFQIPVPGGTKPQPCISVDWANVSTRVKTFGAPLLLQPPPGPGPAPAACSSVEQIKQGPPVVSVIQPRVFAT